MPRVRIPPPERLLGAAHFSADASLRGSLNTVRLVKSQKWVWDGLREACSLEKNYARKRIVGHWELVAVAFIASRQVDIQPFHDEASSELWKACGFDEKPSYDTTRRRLRELETVCDEFLLAASQVIKRCRKHDSRVMSHVHFDYTEDETHATLVHDCKKGDDCAYLKAKAEAKGKSGRTWGYTKQPERVSVKTAREDRHALSVEDPDEATEMEKERAPQKTDEKSGVKRVFINGCWYRIRDKEAGIRAYTGPRGCKRFWVGYYSGKAVDGFTGAIIPSVDSASRQECHLYPELFDRVCEMVGEAPETAIADRGMSVASCFEHTTKQGTAPIFPWRKNGKNGKRHDAITHDRHGIKRCKACGGDMEQTRFSKNNGKPRLWFRCIAPQTAGCEKEQTISCASDWRLLVPLARTNPLYHELEASHKSFEGSHDYWRDRYRVAADTLANRPKAVGLDWHRLRANVACLIDWLRIASKNFWLGTTRAKTRHPGTRAFKRAGDEGAESLLSRRRRAGLTGAYGPQAKALGIGEAKPPSRRPPPKAQAAAPA
jgi:hypothetical protein